MRGEIDAHRKRAIADHPQLTLTDLYNVFQSICNGVKPNELSPSDYDIFDRGLLYILKELYDCLDIAVADAYGWSAYLSNNEILSKLVSLNRERAKEETVGHVQWLRPQYQVPRFGSVREKAELDLSGGEMRAPSLDVAKQSFPSDDVTQTASVMAILAGASAELNADAIASTFKQGRRVSAKVQAVLTALARMGFVDTRDGGRTFVLRRAA